MKRKSKKNYWPLYLLGGGLLASLIFLLYIFRYLWLPEKSSSIQTPNLAPESVLNFRHPLTGEPSAIEIPKPQVFAVMVENSAEAWPLSGLDQAFLVIEAPVEAKIPRLEGFYYLGQKEVEKIGPVRSARPYYVDWAEEFGALYAHVGGSPAALKQITASNDLFDLNEFWHGPNFWREAFRFIPHNVYTSTELLTQAFSNQTSSTDYGLWAFKDDTPTETVGVSDIVLNPDSLLYRVDWKYNATDNNYVRWQGGEAMKTLDDAEITANNVAVVYTNVSVIDAIGRREIETVGEGEAAVYQDGKIFTAVWKKESTTDRLRFYTEDGKEIKWNAGKTWIEVVSTLEKVVSSE